MNILGWLLYLKALLYLLHPVSSMGMWGRLCGAQLANMVSFVCEGRGYYYGEESDSPILPERQAKAFTNGGRPRTGKIVTECCHNRCNLQIIESYCAPLPEGQTRGPERHEFLHEKERETITDQNNRVEPPPLVAEETIVEEDDTVITQELVDTLSDQEDLEDSIESETNLLNEALLMLPAQVRETSEQRIATENEEELLQKETEEKPVTEMTELETQDELIEEEVSENRHRNHLNKTKGNSRTNKPSSRERNSRRKNSRERKKNKTKSGASRERKAKRRNKPKNKKNRRKKPKHEQDDYTQPTDQLITDIEVLHPQVQVLNGESPSRSEPGNVDEAADAGSRSERSFLTTITAKLLDVMGLQQNSNTNLR